MSMLEPKILVVDDDKFVRSALKRLFNCQDWDVTTATNGQEALDHLAEGKSFNVIVADYYMPKVNGIEFLKQVNILYPEAFCIMLTAYPYCDSIKYAMGKYLNAELLQKPWDGSLIEMIENALVMQNRKNSNQRA